MTLRKGGLLLASDSTGNLCYQGSIARLPVLLEINSTVTRAIRDQQHRYPCYQGSIAPLPVLLLIHIHILYACTFIYIYIYIYIYVYTYIYTYVHTYIHACMHTYIHIHNRDGLKHFLQCLKLTYKHFKICLSIKHLVQKCLSTGFPAASHQPHQSTQL